MWTRNYYNLLTAALLCDTSVTGNSTPTDYAPPIRIKAPNGSYYPARVMENVYESHVPENLNDLFALGKNKCNIYYGSSADHNEDFLVGFGTGTAGETYDDYTLTIANGFSIGSNYGTREEATALTPPKTLAGKRSYTITRTGAAVDITEFGIFVPAAYQSSSYDYVALVYRKKFDTPIHFDTGDSFKLVFNRHGDVFNYTPY